jgi:hypothetical protein
VVLLASLLAIPAVTFGHTKYQSKHARHYHCDEDQGIAFDDKIDGITINDDTIIIKHKNCRPYKVEITSDYKLIVDGNHVSLNSDQQKLVTKFYDKTDQLIADAVDVGLEGAAIGLNGVGVAAKAVSGVVNMLFTNYTSDDLERDVEREAAKVERRAAKLEARADKIEDLANEVEDLYQEMEDTIPELRGDI